MMLFMQLVDHLVDNIFLMPTIDIYLSGLLARRQNAWSQDGGNMRVIANGANR